MTAANQKDIFDSWVRLNALGIPKIPKAFVFDGKAKDLETLIAENLDRKPLIEYLKKTQGTDVEARHWSSAGAKIDFMSASERDLRLRFRRRVANFSTADANRTAAAASLTTAAESIAAVAGGNTNP